MEVKIIFPTVLEDIRDIIAIIFLIFFFSSIFLQF